jgi:hypothetical protein
MIDLLKGFTVKEWLAIAGFIVVCFIVIRQEITNFK